MRPVYVMIGFLLIRVTLFAQGIQFQEGLSWQQILSKAKNENKYIFVDCYTTWCGPCKRMEKEVFNQDSVGDVINDKFIAVRVQMDQTSGDNSNTRKWYNTAQKIAKDYHIRSYPTFLFFAPDGRQVDIQTGFQQPEVFIAMARKAGSLTKSYMDPYAEYYSLIAAYNQGKKNLQKMPYMIRKARELIDPMYAKLAREYLDYLEKLPKDKIFTKNNLEFLGSIMTSGNRFFPLFLTDGEKMDKVMESGWFTKGVLYRVIHEEEVLPHLREMALRLWPPNFEQIKSNVSNKYPKEYADWAVGDAKLTWFLYRDENEYIESYLTQIEKYGMDTTDGLQDVDLNNNLWIVFQKSDNVNLLSRAIRLQEGVIRRNCCKPMASKWDTYANLLYKIGRREEAMEWEEKALAKVKEKAFYSPRSIDEYSDNINKMKKGQPTW